MTTWELTGITQTTGQCECCSRRLTQRVFQVTSTETGEVRELGRRCAAKVTGFKVDRVEREARIAARCAVIAERRATLTARYPHLATERFEDFFGEAVCSDYLWNTDGVDDYIAAMAARFAA